MLRILHCADLHLSVDESDYCLAVLDEIIAHAKARGCDWLLIAGDLFDSYPDLEQLKGELRKRIALLPATCRTVLIAGNHERLRLGAKRLQAVDLAPARFIVEPPFELIREGEVELFALPFAASHADYAKWEVAERQAPLRIALAHGSVAGLHYLGADEEEERGVMDPDLFARFGVRVALLGHIHAARTEVVDGVTFSYAGSARVWRRGESGPRGATLLSVAEGAEAAPPSLERIPIAAAGQYRRVELPLNLDGSLPAVGSYAEGWGGADWIEVAVSGVIEDERVLAASEAELKRRFGSKVRRLELTREEVITLEGISTQPMAKRFLELWREREPKGEEERRVWLKARELALRKIKELLEARP